MAAGQPGLFGFLNNSLGASSEAAAVHRAHRNGGRYFAGDAASGGGGGSGPGRGPGKGGGSAPSRETLLSQQDKVGTRPPTDSPWKLEVL